MPIAQYFANKAAFEEKLRTMSAAGFRMYFARMIILSGVLTALAYSFSYGLDLFIVLGSYRPPGAATAVGLLASGAEILAGTGGSPGAYAFWMGSLQTSAAGMIGSYIAIWILMELNLGQAFGQILNILFISLFSSIATGLVSVFLMIVIIPLWLGLGLGAGVGSILAFPLILIMILGLIITLIYYN